MLSQRRAIIAAMGTRNRERRQEKKAKQARQRRAGGSGGRVGQDDVWTSVAQDLAVAVTVREAAEAVFHSRGDAQELLDLLVDGPPMAGGRRIVAKVLREELRSGVETLASGHWYPGEIVGQARRRIGAGGGEVAAAVVLVASRRRNGRPADPTGQADPAWEAEAAAFGAPSWRLEPGAPSWRADVETGVKVLGLLAHLPPLPEPQPAKSTAGHDPGAAGRDRTLEKARHLLAKAESTTFPDEAEALTAKAQELLARHSIDRAAVERADQSHRPTVAVRRIWIEDPYIVAKAQLLHVVAAANRCRSVLTPSIGLATVAGHEDDLVTVEVLFTSLLVQATTQMTAAGSRTDRGGRSRTRSFRQSFLVAFAIRIGERLRAVEEVSVSAGAAAYGDAFLPVLASRSSAADDVIAELFPELEHRGSQANDREGWAAGTLAADLSSLSVQPELFDAVA